MKKSCNNNLLIMLEGGNNLIKHKISESSSLFKITNNIQKRGLGLVLVGSLAVSSLPLWKAWKQVSETRQILKKADESNHWPFAQGVIQSVELEEGKILFGLTNACRLNIKYEYKLGTSQYYQKHPTGSGYRKIDLTPKKLFLDEKDSNVFIPLMPTSIDPEEPLVITSGKPRIFNNDRVFWTVPYWFVGSGEEMKNNLLGLVEEFKKDEVILVRINPIDPKDSVLIAGKQTFDQSWRFTFVYLSIMALLSLITFATTYYSLISTIGEFEINTRSKETPPKEEKSSNWLSTMVWYVNEYYRFFSSVVLNRHKTEALPPPNQNQKPKFIDVNELKEEKN
ncbi:predicted protein [Naegleria gruberi]|uniref:Predicted protein n=1 Tax=Naegleria gruberi TaxID=5762 RepID=D2V1S8_NAEGR|nr:uncharacterized protein NAEGRDRAFT_62681 [Naegleria gruberi]EFC49363.1 predicted protein [Naegleria gruberi]|eukprot:XP_002682107.1 predicted protein [Naegleria gruberi strain NEG-M]